MAVSSRVGYGVVYDGVAAGEVSSSGGLTYPPATLFRMAGMAVDFVVHLTHRLHPDRGNLRYVSEVVEVLPSGDTEEPAINAVYVPGPDGRAVPRTLPQCIADLEAAGFDRGWFQAWRPQRTPLSSRWPAPPRWQGPC
jgi:hypothetical protein